MRPLALLAALSTSVAIVWAGCSGVRPPEPQSEGAAVYTANCAECHGVDAAGLKAVSLRTGFSTTEVADSLSGEFDGHRDSPAADLSPEQVRIVSEYVARLGHNGQ